MKPEPFLNTKARRMSLSHIAPFLFIHLLLKPFLLIIARIHYDNLYTPPTKNDINHDDR
ncbi:hypothetical protein [Rosenbergiella australiborealis]|uniref:Uncharacterized protein n=1 Tax=Rosenbergiella australiborealis TaxID=1544696 RepID=A0ABS5T7Z6_9GAMM|nr:hypothetical protein [Rosenbergiella australiborealis]MBT0728449.1 hypothetical protein [Rosenbergiella australiborealis]